MQQCSAIGAVKRDLLQALYNACQGDSGLKEYEARTGKGKSKDTSSQSDVLDERIRVYFPSSDTVAQSRGGTDVGHRAPIREPLPLVHVLTNPHLVP